MKRCNKPLEKPPLLENFREDNPSGNWDEFRNHNAGEAYESVRVLLCEDQGGLCAYCEVALRRQNQQIGPFHPKSDENGDQNWALAWENLWLTCKGGTQTWMRNKEEYRPPLPENRSCDEAKADRILDGEVLTPNEIPASPRIFRYRNCEDDEEILVLPDEENCQTNGISIEKVHRTIHEFNLNCPRLKEARFAFLDEVDEEIGRLREKEASPDMVRSLAGRFLGKKDGIWPKFFTLSRWRLGKASEDFLSSIGYEG